MDVVSLLGWLYLFVKGTADPHGKVKGMCGFVSIAMFMACVFWQTAVNALLLCIHNREREMKEKGRTYIFCS